MAKLYQLAIEYENLLNQLLDTADTETGEVDIDIAKAVEAIQGSFEEKAVATATVYRIVGTEIDRVKAEIDRLTAIKKHYDNEQKRVKDYLARSCEIAGVESIKGLYANISFRTSEQTVVDNIDELPKEYIRVKVTEEPDKTAIKAALKSGVAVPGTHLEQCRNIQIK